MARLHSPSQLESDAFKIYCYKIVPCSKKFGHDWSECPFAHEGEKATRRCPALYLYSSIVCPDVRQTKPCPRGDVCPYSHSIFEYWMHPARFRAQICSFGPQCNRRICFFAHAQEQLRVPSEPVVADAVASRAPYLQGHVSPKSRFALYPEQVSASIPRQPGLMQQQGLIMQPDLQGGMGGQQLLPQMVLLSPGEAAGQAGMALAGGAGSSSAATGQLAALQQQSWAAGGGGNFVYLPAAAPGMLSAQPPPDGSGYFVAAPAMQPGAAGPGGAMAGVDSMQPQFSAAGGLPASHMHLQAPAPAMYAGRHVQLVAPAGAEGGTGVPLHYQLVGGVSAGAYAGPGPTYVAASMPMQQQQQQWMQQQQQQQQPQQQSLGVRADPQQQQQQLQQLMQAAKGGDVLGGPTSQDSFLITQQQQQLAAGSSSRQVRSLDAAGYTAVLAPAGASASPGLAGACGGSDAAPAPAPGTQVDNLAQQMGGWRIG